MSLNLYSFNTLLRAGKVDLFDMLDKGYSRNEVLDWMVKDIRTCCAHGKLFKIIRVADYRGYLPLETLGEGDPFQKVEIPLKEVRQVL